MFFLSIVVFFVEFIDSGFASLITVVFATFNIGFFFVFDIAAFGGGFIGFHVFLVFDIDVFTVVGVGLFFVFVGIDTSAAYVLFVVFVATGFVETFIGVTVFLLFTIVVFFGAGGVNLDDVVFATSYDIILLFFYGSLLMQI